jgi:hypothetical protein
VEKGETHGFMKIHVDANSNVSWAPPSLAPPETKCAFVARRDVCEAAVYRRGARHAYPSTVSELILDTCSESWRPLEKVSEPVPGGAQS